MVEKPNISFRIVASTIFLTSHKLYFLRAALSNSSACDIPFRCYAHRRSMSRILSAGDTIVLVQSRISAGHLWPGSAAEPRHSHAPETPVPDKSSGTVWLFGHFSGIKRELCCGKYNPAIPCQLPVESARIARPHVLAKCTASRTLFPLMDDCRDLIHIWDMCLYNLLCIDIPEVIYSISFASAICRRMSFNILHVCFPRTMIILIYNCLISTAIET